LRALPDLKTCQKFSGETEAQQEVWGIMKNEMPSLILDGKICFIRLPPDKLQNFWQVVTMFKRISNWLHGWSEHLRDGGKSVFRNHFAWWIDRTDAPSIGEPITTSFGRFFLLLNKQPSSYEELDKPPNIICECNSL
jgi:hypothetical protein